MKSVNFIKPVPPRKQKELAWWLYGSSLFLVLLSGTLLVLHFKGEQHYQTLVRQIGQLNTIPQQVATLKTKRDELTHIKQILDDHLRSIAQQRQLSQAPHHILTHFARIIPASCCLTKVEADTKGNLHIHGQSANAKACATFLDLLASCQHIHDARLVSLSPTTSKKLLSFTIIGSWKSSQHSSEPWAELHG